MCILLPVLMEMYMCMYNNYVDKVTLERLLAGTLYADNLMIASVM